MGFAITIAVLLLLIALAVHNQDWIKARIKPVKNQLPNTSPPPKRAKQPLDVDEFHTFRFWLYRCRDLIKQHEDEGGEPCDIHRAGDKA